MATKSSSDSDSSRTVSNSPPGSPAPAPPPPPPPRRGPRGSRRRPRPPPRGHLKTYKTYKCVVCFSPFPNPDLLKKHHRESQPCASQLQIMTMNKTSKNMIGNSASNLQPPPPPPPPPPPAPPAPAPAPPSPPTPPPHADQNNGRGLLGGAPFHVTNAAGQNVITGGVDFVNLFHPYLRQDNNNNNNNHYNNIQITFFPHPHPHHPHHHLPPPPPPPPPPPVLDRCPSSDDNRTLDLISQLEPTRNFLSLLENRPSGGNAGNGDGNNAPQQRRWTRPLDLDFKL